MHRREFVTASAAAGVTLLCPDFEAVAQTPVAEPLHPAILALRSRVAEAPPPISEEERAERRARAQALMAEHGLAGMFLEPGANLDYFGAVPWGRSERVFGLLVPRTGDAIVVSPAFERQRAERVVNGRFEIRTWEEDESPYELIARVLRERGAEGPLAVDESARFFVAHELATMAAPLRVVPATLVTHPTRGIKSAHEIELMRFANGVTLDAIRAAFATLRVGMTQQELARSYYQALERLGLRSGAWILALIGESSAYPHGAERPLGLRPGDVVLVDAGTSVHGYEADVTRTVAFGEASAEARRVFATVRAAQDAALAAARPGRTAGEIDAVAREVVQRAGFGTDYELFTHRLGHGIGLEGHEWPYLVRGSDVVLRPGMSFSNEPGIYQYGRFGVRLEDIMVITGSGAELLTPQQRSLDPADV